MPVAIPVFVALANCKINTHPATPLYLFLAAGSHTGLLSTPISLPSAGIFQDHYRYTDDLLRLSASSSTSIPHHWTTYQSPIKLEELAPFLCIHPDQALASYIRTGLSTGFRVGFNHDRAQLRSRGKNHPSALANPTVIDQRI